jgi:hypothetical protein
VLQVLIALPPEKMLPVSLGYEFNYIPESVWTLWIRENFFAPAGNRTLAVESLARRFTG